MGKYGRKEIKCRTIKTPKNSKHFINDNLISFKTSKETLLLIR
jgi:hypothetical protein